MAKNKMICKFETFNRAAQFRIICIARATLDDSVTPEQHLNLMRQFEEWARAENDHSKAEFDFVRRYLTSEEKCLAIGNFGDPAV